MVDFLIHSEDFWFCLGCSLLIVFMLVSVLIITSDNR